MIVARRVLALLRPHAMALGIAASLAAVIAACRGALVWLVREVLDDLLAQGDARIWLLPAAVVLLFALQGAARATRTWLTRRAAIQTEARLRHQLYLHMLRRPPAALHSEGVGDALSRLSHDAGTVRTAVGAAVTLVQRPLSALVLLGVAGAMAPRLFFWALLGLPVVVAVVVWTGRRTRIAARAHAESLGALESLARDVLGGLRTVQAYGSEGAAGERFHRTNDAQVAAALETTGYRVVGPPLVELAAAAGMAAVIAVGAAQVHAGALTAGGLVAFLVALGLWSEARGGLGRVFEALDLPQGAQDAPGARPLEPGPVQLDLVGLVVDRGRGPILRGVDLCLAPGTITVLRGASGAGKSTLIDVIAAFCPGSGDVTWNGRPAELITVASRRGAIALVEQEPWLGAGTVADAILLGRPTASRAELVEAARAAGLDPNTGLLAGLPGGLDGEVGDGGGSVSGGERQRIALARALLRGAPVLLMDEPTANLDPQTEAAFLATLRAVLGQQTVLIATHRPGPVAIADVVVDLIDGTLQSRPMAVAAS